MDHLKLGFAGTPDFAARILTGLLADGCRPAVVYTQPDRPVGRGRKARAGPVRLLADSQGIAVMQPHTLRDRDAASTLAEFALDVLVVAAYGLLLPDAVLQVPTLGCINVHASLLPRWRGAAPVERAIMAGDTRTGVSIMRMDRGLDTGPVYLTRGCPIGALTTGPELESVLADLGTGALLECLRALPKIEPRPQPSNGVCYAHKLTSVDAVIDWRADADSIDRQVRALCGRLPAVTYANGTRVQILAATPVPGWRGDHAPGTVVASTLKAGIWVACGSGALSISRLRINRGKGQPLFAAEALNGFHDLLGEGRVFRGEPC